MAPVSVERRARSRGDARARGPEGGDVGRADGEWISLASRCEAEGSGFDLMKQKTANAIGINWELLVELRSCAPRGHSLPDRLDEGLVRLVLEGRCSGPRRRQHGVVRHQRGSPQKLVVTPHPLHDEPHHFETRPIVLRGFAIVPAAESKAPGERLLEQLVHSRFASQRPGLTSVELSLQEMYRADDVLRPVFECRLDLSRRRSRDRRYEMEDRVFIHLDEPADELLG